MKPILRSVSGYGVGLLIGGMVFGGITFATTGLKPIQVHYANIKIAVNGKVIPTSAEPFIYNSNVYVPISAIGHGLGAQVNWVGKSHEVAIARTPQLKTQSGALLYYGSPVLWYGSTHTFSYKGQSYVSPIALAAVLGEPVYVDPKTLAAYIGRGPSSGMPLADFPDVRDYGDYAAASNGSVGAITGWNNGQSQIAGQLYPNSNGRSILWSSAGGNPQIPGVTYNLNGKYTSLTGLFGVDDASGSSDQLQLTITGDGQQLYQSPWMSKGQTATPVEVNVSNVNLLTVAFSVKTSSGAIYTMGQSVPKGTAVNADFVDVLVH
ncbi:MAG: stalk domain-containing protein [Bacilli bacterium]